MLNFTARICQTPRIAF